MDVGRLLIWVLSAGIFTALILFFGNILRKKAAKWVNILVFALKVVAIPLLGLLLVYWDSAFVWKFNLPVAAVYGAVLGSACADVIRLALRLFGRKCRKEKIGMFSGVGMEALIIAAVFLYGTINIMIVTPRNWTVTSEKLDHSYRVVFLSDIHAGSVQPFSVIEKVLENVKREQPDLLVVGGDITDEFSSKEDAEKVWEVIGSVGVPAVFVWGNHDRQNCAALSGGGSYSVQEITAIIEKNGVTILDDDYFQFAPDLLLYGRDDLLSNKNRKDILPSENPSPDSFFIILDHEQVAAGGLPDTGADLQLSGHSHAGQYFPLEMIYTLADAYPSGQYGIGDSQLIVSTGEGGWRSPFRTEGHCHYEVVELLPAE